MLSQIKRNGQTKPILSAIGRQRLMRPDIKNVYVTPAGFKSLLAAMPNKEQAKFKDEINCDDFTIKIYKG